MSRNNITPLGGFFYGLVIEIRERFFMDFVLATTNQGKVMELQALLGINHNVRTMADVGFTDEIFEYGETFEENALIKVNAVCGRVSADYILADDSGIEIDALGGKPGVQSARWLGVNTPYTEKNRQVLEMLVNVTEENRTARFVSIIACAGPNRQILTAKGLLEGRIAFEPMGAAGFGYDPIFFIESQNRTLAQLNREEKNLISHRAMALRNIFNMLGIVL